MAVRRPDFAGSWYPSSERECRAMFEEFEARCVERRGAGTPRGGIVPHAGWVYSGRIAYNVVRELARALADPPETVVLFGRHLSPTSSATIMERGEVWTPFGDIPTDEELATRVRARADARTESPERHAADNTMELQLPILRHLLPRSRVVLIAAPPRPETLALAHAVVDEARALGRRIAVLGSTDLTHYGPNYDWSPKGLGPEAERWVREENDAGWIERARRLDPQGAIDEALERSSACCPGAAAAAIQCALDLGATEGELLAYATSADVHRSSSFVGYAGLLI